MQMVFLWALFSVVSAMLMPEDAGNPYATPCTGELTMYAFGNSTCRTLSTWRRTPCMCPDKRYAQTAVQCIFQMVTEVRNIPESAQNQTLAEAYAAFLKLCPQYTMDDVNSYRGNSSSLKAYDGNTTGVKAGVWPVNGPFLLPNREIENAYNSWHSYATSEDRNKGWGAGLLGFWAFVLLVKGITHVFGRIFQVFTIKLSNKSLPRLMRRHFIIRQDKNLNALGVSQIQAVLIIAFMILVVFATFLNLPTSIPNYNYSYDTAYTWGACIGQRSGVLVMYLVPLLILFAGRNNFLQYITGWPLGPFLLFHKWIARSVVFLLLVHAIGYSIARSCTGRYNSMWKVAYWNWGVVGVAFAFFLFVQGLRFVRRKAYDLFVVLHILGVIFFLVGGWYHLKLLDELYGLYFLYASFAVWAFDRAMRLVKVLAAGFHKKAHVKLHDGILAITIDQPTHWKLHERPGKYMFIHFWQPSIFWQSHPFTLTVNPINPKQLKLFCKVHGGATKHIADQVMISSDSLSEASEKKNELSSPKDVLQKEMTVLLDGPYGHSYDLLEFDECIFVAGGTGITPCFSYIHSSLYNYPNSSQKFKLFWAVRDEASAEVWFEEELKYLRDFPSRVEVIIFSSNHGNKLNVIDTVKPCITESTGKVSVMCCGPSAMCLNTREAVSDSMDLTENYVEYIEELFNW